MKISILLPYKENYSPEYAGGFIVCKYTKKIVNLVIRLSIW